ncbi:hypothetical protein PVE_R2G0547 [Pseudomonas veronii 1YdBTEX2]|uniref:Uncharacterized protein n=1 Tax=Pseudomonas veronii 1YdBTEX2 TaxID=1295141 RepID=A0A1D3K877_PSEVE|nr:hypothetical protein [Pseudomonas sp. AP19]OEC63816.1 hypothetical protein A7D21_28460 [Pseudomonas sp. AP19]SBW84573.1 hypothetical protein PVE_R2G0547 [Pseudomonas veronii 1YdBTEX2]
MNTQTEGADCQLTPEMQLATLLCIQSLFNEGFKATSIVGKLAEKVVNSAEREGWEKVMANLIQESSLNNSLIGTGLFTTSIERILAIIERPDRAIEVAIDLLKAIR